MTPRSDNRFQRSGQLLRLLQILLMLCASWPLLRWYQTAVFHYADTGIGPLAFAFAIAFLWRAPLGPSFGIGLAVALLAQALTLFFLPDLLRALLLLPLLALAWTGRRASPELWAALGLGVLGLPIIPHLDFYLSYPVRAAFGELSRFLLTTAGLPVVREGVILRLDSVEVLVDAPCSGIRMLWTGLFLACASTGLLRLSPWRMILLFGVALAAIAIANVARSIALFALESGLIAAPGSAHEGFGLLAFAGGGLMILTAAIKLAPRGVRSRRVPVMTSERKRRSIWPTLIVAGIVALLPFAKSEPVRVASPEAFSGWPQEFEGEPLIPLGLDPVELRFAAELPGRVQRFRAGDATVVIRWVDRATRHLHAASFCYRGGGYSLKDLPVHRDAKGQQWRAYEARGHGRAHRVHQRIVDARGQGFLDESEWYWAASRGAATPPYMAFTVATRISE